MLALIDADILPYELGAVFDETVSPGHVYQAVDDKINTIIRGAKAHDAVYFLTNSKANFRLARATVAPYKGQRPSEKNFWWHHIRDYIISMYEPVIADGNEADDLIIDYHKKDIETVICSRDKDLDTSPGWHYRWKCGERQPERRYYVPPHEAWQFFYYQLLAGDIVDNIKGVYGVGPKKATKILAPLEDKHAMREAVCRVYIDVYGGGSNKHIHYEDCNKNKHWKRPTEIMEEMADLLYLGSDRSYLDVFEQYHKD